MKRIIMLLLILTVLSWFSCDRMAGERCRAVTIGSLKLTEIQNDWDCIHSKYAWSQYDGRFEINGRIISSDVWEPHTKENIFQYKELLYCDTILLEEIDVYNSPNTYLTIDGECNEILSIGYDFYDCTWRCSIQKAIHVTDSTDSTYCGRYGFKTIRIDKGEADSIIKSWQINGKVHPK